MLLLVTLVRTPPPLHGSSLPLEKMILDEASKSAPGLIPPKYLKTQSYCGVRLYLLLQFASHEYLSYVFQPKADVAGSSPRSIGTSLHVWTSQPNGTVLGTLSLADPSKFTHSISLLLTVFPTEVQTLYALPIALMLDQSNAFGSALSFASYSSDGTVLAAVQAALFGHAGNGASKSVAYG